MNIIDQIKNDPKYSAKASNQWFMKKVQALSGGQQFTSMKMLASYRQALVNQVLPGKMYAFTYNPKYRDTLPYYDLFPLIFPFTRDQESFTGINLHYLPPILRGKMFDALLKYSQADKNKDGDIRRLRLSWEFLSNAAKFPLVAPCVKKYLYGHVMTKFIEIPPADWKMAVFLPTESFRKASARDVWAQSKRY